MWIPVLASSVLVPSLAVVAATAAPSAPARPNGSPTASDVEFAKALVYRAAWSPARGEPTVTRDVSMAKALANEAAYRTSRATMQVHGGIGYTWEADLQVWMKKATNCR